MVQGESYLVQVIIYLGGFQWGGMDKKNTEFKCNVLEQ